MPGMGGLEFEWDDAKDAANTAKHGVGFVIARNVFKDVFAIERVDDRQDYGEERYNIIGWSKTACSSSFTR